MDGGVERVKMILPKANPSQSDQCAWNRLTCPNSVTGQLCFSPEN